MVQVRLDQGADWNVARHCTRIKLEAEQVVYSHGAMLRRPEAAVAVIEAIVKRLQPHMLSGSQIRWG